MLAWNVFSNPMHMWCFSCCSRVHYIDNIFMVYLLSCEGKLRQCSPMLCLALVSLLLLALNWPIQFSFNVLAARPHHISSRFSVIFWFLCGSSPRSLKILFSPPPPQPHFSWFYFFPRHTNTLALNPKTNASIFLAKESISSIHESTKGHSWLGVEHIILHIIPKLLPAQKARN